MWRCRLDPNEGFLAALQAAWIVGPVTQGIGLPAEALGWSLATLRAARALRQQVNPALTTPRPDKDRLCRPFGAWESALGPRG